ncbi:MAG: Fur family transcriptional regulator, partial [Bacillota bacterium]
KVTPQRVAVYNMLLNTEEHPDAETIYKSLEETNPTISVATIYKTLDFFKSLDLVHELNVGQGRCRYDANVDTHPHMVCRTCGTVYDLFLEELQGLDRKIPNELGFAVEREQLIFYGKCKECQREE